MGPQQSQPKAPTKNASDQMFEMIFEFRTMARSFQKESKRAENEEKKAIMRVKDVFISIIQAIEKNLGEAARIHASDAIRKKNEAKRYLVLSSKLDAVQSRLQAAYNTSRVTLFNLQLTENMQKLTDQLYGALGAMDLVKVNETMARFEQMFDNLDVNSELMDKAMDNINAGTYQEKDVNSLINQVAEQFNLQLKDELADVSTNTMKTGETNKEANKNVAVSNPHV